jgi:prepilin-type N-terminal cleavage/methylation domain-containing protein
MNMATQRNGFTLIEVVVSLAIAAMVLTSAFLGLSLGIRGWEKGRQVIDRMEGRAAVERLIHRQAAAAYPLRIGSGPRSIVFFRGSANHLEFISDYALEDGAGELRKIDYAADRGRFLYSETPIHGIAFERDETLPPKVLSTFDQLSFEYLAGDGRGAPVWITDWPSGAGLPAAVQVHLGGDTLVVALVNR